MVREPINFGNLTREQRNKWVWWVLNRTRHLDTMMATLAAANQSDRIVMDGYKVLGRAILATMDYLRPLGLDHLAWAARLKKIRAGEINKDQCEQAQLGQSVGLRVVETPTYTAPTEAVENVKQWLTTEDGGETETKPAF